MRALVRILIVAMFLPAAAWAGPPAIDLTAQPWYIKPGFGHGDRAGFDPAAGRPAGAFPIVPNRIFGVLMSDAYTDYALETTLSLEALPAAYRGRLGLFFPAIGENWEIFVNGVQIAGEIPPTLNGRPVFRRSVRDLAVPLPPEVLRAGENRLVVHLAGDAPRTPFAWNTALGFYKRNGYRVEPYQSSHVAARQLGGLAIVSLFFFIGAYALVMFFYRPVERAHLYFGLLASVMSLYYLTRTTVLYSLSHDTMWILRMEYASLALAGPCVLWFVHSFLEPDRPVRPFVKLYSAVSACLFAGAVAVHYAYLDVVLILWQALSLGGVSFVVVELVTALAQRKPPALQLVPGLVALVAAVAWDIIDTMWIFSNHQFGRYAFAFLILNLAVIITGRTLKMRSSTQQGVRRLAESEQRLRALFEAGFEAIVMTAGGHIVDANPAFRRLFGYSLEQALGKPVTDLFARPGAPPGLPGTQTLMRRANGSTFFAECWQLISRDGQATLVVRDVDDKRRAANELAERNHELEVLVRSMADREKRMRELENELASRHPVKP